VIIIAQNAQSPNALAQKANVVYVVGMHRCLLCSVFVLVLCWPAWLAAGNAPRRIVSLSPAITSEIQDLGQGHRLVGVTRYCPNASGKAVVGTLTEINIERILTLKPDLVLAGKDCNRRRDVEKLQSLGIAVAVFEGCEDFECMCREFIRLGTLLGRRQAAQDITAQVRADLHALEAGLPRRTVKVFWQVGVNPIVTVNGETFAGEILRRMGGVNVFADVAAKYPRVNREEVLVRNPEAIIIAAGMGADENPWAGLKQITAVRSGRVYRIPADKLCQPTPRKFLEACRMVAGALYPGLRS